MHYCEGGAAQPVFAALVTGALAAGGNHTCALVFDGALGGLRAACWGLNDAGEASPPLSISVGVTAGGRHSCTLDTAGAVHCFGDNTWGQLGQQQQHPARARAMSVAQQPPPAYAAVAAGVSHTCALVRGTGAATCWGRSDGGETSVPAAGPGGFVRLAAGGRGACAIAATDGRIECWGSWAGGADGALAEGPIGGAPNLARELPYSDVCVGYAHACAITATGAFDCWGPVRLEAVKAIPPSIPYVALSCGAWSTCAARADGSISCFGRLGNTTATTTPAGFDFALVAAGGRHACGLTRGAARRVLCWGACDEGQCNVPPAAAAGTAAAAAVCSAGSAGDGTTCNACEPGLWSLNAYTSCLGRACDVGTYGAGGAAGPAAAACAPCACGGGAMCTTRGACPATTVLAVGVRFVCALEGDGSVRCDGNAGEGPSFSCNNGNADPSDDCVDPGPISEGAQDDDRYYNDQVYQWAYGVPGSGDASQSSQPAPPARALEGGRVMPWTDAYTKTFGAPPPGGTFLSISAGAVHACGLRVNGSASCWGLCTAGQCDLPAGTQFAQIDAGFAHTCGVTTRGALLCVGDDSYGRVDRSNHSYYPRVPLPGGSDWIFVSAGDRIDCGIRADYSLECWGETLVWHPAGISDDDRRRSGLP